MNRRQRKKAFKKKYGMNPAQFYKEFDKLTLSIQNIDWEAIGRAMAEAIQTAVTAASAALQKTADYLTSPEAEALIQNALIQEEEKQMKKEDALEIGLAINAIATLLDDRSLAKVERYLKRIEEITIKYVQEDKQENGH